MSLTKLNRIKSKFKTVFNQNVHFSQNSINQNSLKCEQEENCVFFILFFFHLRTILKGSGTSEHEHKHVNVVQKRISDDCKTRFRC
jgi:hypothetical protein